MGCTKNNSMKEVHSDKYVLKKQEKSQTNNLTLYLKELEKEEQSPTLVEGKYRAKVNKMTPIKYTDKTIQEKPHIIG